MKLILLALLLVLSACGSGSLQGQGQEDLPPITGTQLQQLLNESERPTVVNIWASWCGPCRSEAPLLRGAVEQFGDQVDFVGIDVQDTQAGAKDFIAEYGLDGIDHHFDRSRSVPQHYGGIGTPITFFFDSGGDLISTHLGVIDDRALALGIDEIINR